MADWWSGGGKLQFSWGEQLQGFREFERALGEASNLARRDVVVAQRPLLQYGIDRRIGEIENFKNVRFNGRADVEAKIS